MFCTPALRRLSRIIVAKQSGPITFIFQPSRPTSAARFFSSTLIVRCGLRGFDGERPGHADRLLVLVGLVVERFALGVPGDGRVDLRPRHAFLDVRVVGDALQRDVRHALVDEALADVVVESACRSGGILPVSLGLFLACPRASRPAGSRDTWRPSAACGPGPGPRGWCRR